MNILVQQKIERRGGSFSIMTLRSSIAYRAQFAVLERLKSLTRCSFHLMRSDVSVFERNVHLRTDTIPPPSRQLTIKLIWLGCTFTYKNNGHGLVTDSIDSKTYGCCVTEIEKTSTVKPRYMGLPRSD